MSKKIIATLAIVATLFVVAAVNVLGLFEVNDLGYRTVVQPWKSGEVREDGTSDNPPYVVFKSGIFYKGWGTTTRHPNELTYDFGPGGDGVCSYEAGDGLRVRYSDGGRGNVCGLVRLSLPTTESEMLAIHEKYRSEEGIRTKLLRSSVEKALTLTAQFMTSDESYGSKRTLLLDTWSRAQAELGPFTTTSKEVETTSKVINDKGEVETITKVSYVSVPATSPKTGELLSTPGILVDLDLRFSDWSLKALDYEKDTRTQITEKRSASLAANTAQANAEKAYFQEQEEIAKGKKQVAIAEYEQLKEKKKQVVQAQREAAKRNIRAQADLDVKNKQLETAKADVEVARAFKEAKDLRTEAEANMRRKLAKADGSLQARLEAQVKIEAQWAQAYAMRAVPQTEIISASGAEGVPSSSRDMDAFMSTITARTAQQLAKAAEASR